MVPVTFSPLDERRLQQIVYVIVYIFILANKQN